MKLTPLMSLPCANLQASSSQGNFNHPRNEVSFKRYCDISKPERIVAKTAQEAIDILKVEPSGAFIRSSFNIFRKYVFVPYEKLYKIDRKRIREVICKLPKAGTSPQRDYLGIGFKEAYAFLQRQDVRKVTFITRNNIYELSLPRQGVFERRSRALKRIKQFAQPPKTKDIFDPREGQNYYQANYVAGSAMESGALAARIREAKIPGFNLEIKFLSYLDSFRRPIE